MDIAFTLSQTLQLMQASIDKRTAGTKIIDNAHHEIHDACAYAVSGTVTTANQDDHVTVVTIKTPDDPTLRLHMFAFVSASSAAWFYIYEGSVIADNQGTSLITAYNSDYNSNKGSQIWETKSNPDTQGSAILWDNTDAAAQVTLAGTLKHSELIGAGRNSFAISRNLGEKILEPNTNYAYVLENEGAAANIHNILLNWYETHDKKEYKNNLG